MRAYKTATQTITNGTSLQMVFEEEAEFGGGNEFNPATGVFTAASGGVYLVGCSAAFTAAGRYFADITKNGTQTITHDMVANNETIRTSTIIALAAGENVSCWMTNFSGASRSFDISVPWQQIQNTMTVARISLLP